MGRCGCLLPVAFAFLTGSHLAADVVAPSSASGVPFGLALLAQVLDVDEDGGSEEPQDHHDAGAEDQQAAPALLACLLLAHLLGDGATAVALALLGHSSAFANRVSALGVYGAVGETVT